MSILTEQAELWVNAVNKQTGQVYKTIWNCTDIGRWEKEEADLAKRFTEAFVKWNASDANKQLLKYDPNNKEGCGFKFLDGDFEYKLLEFTTKDGKTYKTLGKRKTGGFKGGGSGSGGSRSYTLLRTVRVSVGTLDQISELINNQTENENWSISYIKTDEKGDHFLAENKQAYVPQTVTAGTTTGQTKDDTKDGNQEESSAEEAS